MNPRSTRRCRNSSAVGKTGPRSIGFSRTHLSVGVNTATRKSAYAVRLIDGALKLMKILLVGATGMIGSRILREAVSRGHGVRAAARHLENIPQGQGIEPVQLDAND